MAVYVLDMLVMMSTYAEKWVDVLGRKLGQSGSVHCPIGVVTHQLDIVR